jgi:hypothetical protein
MITTAATAGTIASERVIHLCRDVVTGGRLYQPAAIGALASLGSRA